MNQLNTIHVIVTGATGMVGEGVLQQCLQHPQVAAVLVINRKPCGVRHAKLKEIIHADFFDLSAIENELQGYQACFFCLGISSVGVDTATYYQVTYTLTLYVAGILNQMNPAMTFSYVSGVGTDRSEKGRLYWARVKGKTENDLCQLPFRRVYTFRPGYLQPAPGANHTLKLYRYTAWLYPLLKKLFPGYVNTLQQVGLAMIQATLQGDAPGILQPKDIARLAGATHVAG